MVVVGGCEAFVGVFGRVRQTAENEREGEREGGGEREREREREREVVPVLEGEK